jgi:hypothetical protein
LFKKLSPDSEDKNTLDIIEPQITESPDDATDAKNINFEQDFNHDKENSNEAQNKESSYNSEQEIEAYEVELTEEHQKLLHDREPASELTSDTEFDDIEIEPEPEPELNVAEHLPESIMPGVWLEIYQGEDRAKRRLKFSSADIETNQLLFSDRTGDYKFEIDLQTFMDDLSTGRSSLISENNRFDLALSSVISNIRSSQDNSN